MKSHKNNAYFTRRPIYACDRYLHVQREMLQTKVVDKMKIHFYVQ